MLIERLITFSARSILNALKQLAVTY